ncbi:universal stress protein [Niabella drilacis]|uniref:Universal stress protein family protein n=1 Tax=Niabella drilacis (strain DSM 25811 / CCM 8410 / CCUG 62505 / LMG 26954 / E90) TaxID=1285928 RepID=A0A1G6RDH2_NIADE|nr:universal stress protein [Niabella drilacis]SDD02087.1 Universal stress protein family protein [Niabella drilacis]
MKKIIFITNGCSLDCDALDVACYIAGNARASIKGLFFEAADAAGDAVLSGLDPAPCGDILGEPDTIGFETATETRALNIQRFRTLCEKRNIVCTIHCMGEYDIAEALIESRFADLIVAGEKTAASDAQGRFPAPLLKALLQKAECPVIIASERISHIDEVVFAYDGSASSVFAIRQFAYLLPFFDNRRMIVVQVGDIPEVSYKQQVSELLKGYYSQIGYEVVHGKDPAFELFNFLKRRDHCFIVMGAYGRAYLSRLFKDSTAEPLIQLMKQPVFITHH